MSGNNNNNSGSGKHPNSPRYSERYGKGHINPYLGGQPKHETLLNEIKERQDAVRRENEAEARRAEALEAERRAAEAQNAAAEAQPEQEAHTENSADAGSRPPVRSTARRRVKDSDSQPKAMNDPQTQDRLRQIREQAMSEARAFRRSLYPNGEDFDEGDMSPDVKLKLSEDNKPLIALESRGSDGQTEIRWIPVVLSEEEMATFFPAVEPERDSKGIILQENNDISTNEEMTPTPDEDGLVLIPIAGWDDDPAAEPKDSEPAAESLPKVSPAAAIEIIDSTADGEPSQEDRSSVDRRPRIEHVAEPDDFAVMGTAGSEPAEQAEPNNTASENADASGQNTNEAADAQSDSEDAEPAQAAEDASGHNGIDEQEAAEALPENTESDGQTEADDKTEEADAAEDQPSGGDPHESAETGDGDASDVMPEPEGETAPAENAEDPAADEAAENSVINDSSDDTVEESADTPEAIPYSEQDISEQENSESENAESQEDRSDGDRPDNTDSTPVSRPKKKRRRPRPEGAEHSASPASDEAPEHEVLAVPEEAESDTDEGFSPVRRAAIVSRVSYSDAVDNSYNQDETLFIRKKRPAGLVQYPFRGGASLPQYVNDDDFVERWLGNKEDDDMASDSKRKRRRISTIIGAVTMVLALIGFIAIARWGIGLLSGISNTDTQKTEYAEFISPVVMSEVPLFETWDAIPQDKLLQSAVFSVLLEMDVSYERDDTGKFIIPSTDIVNAVKKLYGASSDDPAQDEEINTVIRNALYGSAGEDTTNTDVYYVDMEDSFHVADGLSGPSPQVTDISRRDNTVTLTVRYLEDLEIGSGSLLYSRQYILTLSDSGYFVNAIREYDD